VALLDKGNERVTFWSRQQGELFTHSLPGSGSVQFMADGKRMLVETKTELTLLDREGSVLWSYPLDGELPHNVVMTGNGEYIAVATGLQDSMIYLFDAAGKALWKYPVEFGGTNKLQFSSDDRWLAVYDAGAESASVYLFNSEKGELVWITRFLAGEGHKLSAESVRFGESIVVSMVDSFEDLQGNDVTVQYLAGLNYAGEAQWKVNMGLGVNTIVAPAARRVLVKVPVRNEEGRITSWTLRLHELPQIPDAASISG
jgi:outer membrane protein assembly factor BamB